MRKNASVQGSNVRISDEKGNSVKMFGIGPGATHAIMEGETVNVFYRKGGVKVYTSNGSIQSFSGICS
jgi:hypothetical protein